MTKPAPEQGAPKRERRPEVPAFGRLLKRLRKRRFPKGTPETVAAFLETKYEVKTTGGSIRGYELGWNKKVDPVVLAGLARAYGFPLEDLITVLAANRSNADLSDFVVEQVLRKARETHHAEATAAARYAEVGARLQEISVELAVFASEAAELVGRADPRKQTSKDR